MKLVDAFLFSEEHEKEILLLKFILSSKYVDEYILCENAYSHQGDYKGLMARKVLENDERFKPFLQKIKIIEGEKQFTVIDKTKMQDSLAFVCENWQRNLAYDFFIENYSDEDWIAINDCDEMFDFTNTEIVNEFFERLNAAKSEGSLVVPRIRYWYDFDNLYVPNMSSVLCTRAFLLEDKKRTLSAMRSSFNGLNQAKNWHNNVIFEYTSCYSFDAIVRKLDTNPHTGMSKEALIRALRYNSRTLPVFYNYLLKPTPFYFFETIELNYSNSPKYVRENIKELKTNVVDKNYLANRRGDFPQFYTFYYKPINKVKEIIKIKEKIIRKKFNFFLIKIGFK